MRLLRDATMTAPDETPRATLAEDERAALGCTCPRSDTGWHIHGCPAPAVEHIKAAARAAAWDEGYARGVRDECSDLERADNPHRFGAS
jgi:hypothetical protein